MSQKPHNNVNKSKLFDGNGRETEIAVDHALVWMLCFLCSAFVGFGGPGPFCAGDTIGLPLLVLVLKSPPGPPKPTKTKQSIKQALQK